MTNDRKQKATWQLHQAAAQHKVDEVHNALRLGGDPNGRTTFDNAVAAALHLTKLQLDATEKQAVHLTIKTLLDNGAKLTGPNLLSRTIRHNLPHTFQLLQEHGWSIHERNPTDEGTPLEEAVWNQQLWALEQLLAQQANPNQPNHQGKYLLDLAIELRWDSMHNVTTIENSRQRGIILDRLLDVCTLPNPQKASEWTQKITQLPQHQTKFCCWLAEQLQNLPNRAEKRR